MKVHWTDTAQAHLDAIHAYIAQDSTHFASAQLINLPEDHSKIAKFPFSGRRVVPEYDIDPIREVIEGSYRIIYYVKSDQIDVLAVIHGAMDVFETSGREKG